MATTAPATIVDWIEAHKTGGEPLTMSEPSKTWVDRVFHASLDLLGGTISEAEYARLSDLFDDYVMRLDGHEQGMTSAVYLFLLEFLEEHDDSLGRCEGCGAVLCPHCGERYSEQSH